MQITENIWELTAFPFYAKDRLRLVLGCCFLSGYRLQNAKPALAGYKVPKPLYRHCRGIYTNHTGIIWPLFWRVFLDI